MGLLKLIHKANSSLSDSYLGDHNVAVYGMASGDAAVQDVLGHLRALPAARGTPW